jgi:Flp pilus assembly protein CpaB
MKSHLPRWFKVTATLTICGSLLLVCSIVLVKTFSTGIPPEHSKIDVEIPQESKVTVDVQRELSPDFDVIRKVLPPGMQLYTIKMHNVDYVVGEMLKPGCFVDVFVSFPRKSSAGNGEDEAVSKALLKKVQMISVKGEFDKPIHLDEEGKILNSSPPYWKELFVTLAVDTKQAEQLQLASKQGDIKLVRHLLDQPLKETAAESTQIDDAD